MQEARSERELRLRVYILHYYYVLVTSAKILPSPLLSYLF